MTILNSDFINHHPTNYNSGQRHLLPLDKFHNARERSVAQ